MGLFGARGIDADADADKGATALYLFRFEEAQYDVLRLWSAGLSKLSIPDYVRLLLLLVVHSKIWLALRQVFKLSSSRLSEGQGLAVACRPEWQQYDVERC